LTDIQCNLCVVDTFVLESCNTTAKDGSRLQIKHLEFRIVMKIYLLAADPEPRE